mgnify:FL=1
MAPRQDSGASLCYGKRHSREWPYENSAPQSCVITISAQALNKLQCCGLPPGVRALLLVQRVMPEAYLRSLHALIAREGSLSRLFWHQQTRPQAEKGSWEEFLAWCNAGITLLLWYETEIVGLCRGTTVVEGKSAEISGWYRRKLWRKVPIRLCTNALCQWCCETFGLQELWMKTIFLDACLHAQHATGATIVETFQDCILYNDQLKSVFVLKTTPLRLVMSASALENTRGRRLGRLI